VIGLEKPKFYYGKCILCHINKNKIKKSLDIKTWEKTYFENTNDKQQFGTDISRCAQIVIPVYLKNVLLERNMALIKK
jgi:hypothetical protein